MGEPLKKDIMENSSPGLYNLKLNYGRILYNDILNSNGNINEIKEDILNNINILETNLKDKQTNDLVCLVKSYTLFPKIIDKTQLLNEIQNYIN